MAKSRDAREIMQFFLGNAFPGATDESLEHVSSLMVRWGAAGVGYRMSPELTVRLVQDLARDTRTRVALDVAEELQGRAAEIPRSDIPWRRRGESE
ncbi:conserved hypothetical protein [Frankia sp. AgKG'84/4]